MKRTFTLDDTCVLWMPFYLHGLENTKMLDYSQHHNDGTRYGAIPTTNGWYFDGVDDYIDCGNDSSLDITNEITLTAWINNRNGGLNKANNIIYKFKAYDIWMYSEPTWGATLKNAYLFRAFSSGTPYGSTMYTVGKYNIWVMVTGTAKVGDAVKLYINGELKKSGDTLPGAIDTNTNIFRIGHDLEMFAGDLKIFNRALSQEEIQSMYNKERKIFGV